MLYLLGGFGLFFIGFLKHKVSQEKLGIVNKQYNDLLGVERSCVEAVSRSERKIRDINAVNATVVSQAQINAWDDEVVRLNREIGLIDDQIKALQSAYDQKRRIEAEEERKRRKKREEEEEAQRRRRRAAAASSSYSSSSSSWGGGGGSSWGGGGGGFSGGGASGSW